MTKRNNARSFRLILLIFTNYITFTARYKEDKGEVFAIRPGLEFVGYTWVTNLPDSGYEFLVCYVKGDGYLFYESLDNSHGYEVFVKLRNSHMYTVSFLFKHKDSEDFKNNYNTINDDNLLESLKRFKSAEGVDVSAIEISSDGVENTDNMMYTNNCPPYNKAIIVKEIQDHNFGFNNILCNPRYGVSYFSIGLIEEVNKTSRKVTYSDYTGYINTDGKKKRTAVSSNFSFYDSDIYDPNLIKEYLHDITHTPYKSKRNKPIIVLSVIGTLVICGGVGSGVYYYITRRKNKKERSRRVKVAM